MSLKPLATFSLCLRASSSRLRPIITNTRLARKPIDDAIPLLTRSIANVSLSHMGASKGAVKRAHRVGRGSGSKKGGHTTGRGHKGQKSRKGKRQPYVGFEGGQTPFMNRIPRHGFNNFTRKTYAPLNIEKLQTWIAQGRIDPSLPITIRTVVKSNVIHGLGKAHGVKLLGDPDPLLPLPPLTIHLSQFSKTAGQAIQEAGGTCLAVYHNRLSLMQELRPHKFEGKRVEMARPTRRADILYYTNPRKFGYLADVKEEFLRERGFNPEVRRGRVAGQMFQDTRDISPEEAAAQDAARAAEKMANVLRIPGENSRVLSRLRR